MNEKTYKCCEHCIMERNEDGVIECFDGTDNHVIPCPDGCEQE